MLSSLADDATRGNPGGIIANHGSTYCQEIAYPWIRDPVVCVLARASRLDETTPAQAAQVRRDAALRNANCLDEHVELIVDWFDGANWEQAKANLDARD